MARAVEISSVWTGNIIEMSERRIELVEMVVSRSRCANHGVKYAQMSKAASET